MLVRGRTLGISLHGHLQDGFSKCHHNPLTNFQSGPKRRLSNSHNSSLE